MIQVVQFNLQSLSIDTCKCVQILKTSGNNLYVHDTSCTIQLTKSFYVLIRVYKYSKFLGITSVFMIQVVQFNLPSPSMC